MNKQQWEQALNRAYQSGVAAGQQNQGYVADQQMAQSVQQLRAEFESKMNQQAGGLRKAMNAKQAHLDEKLGHLAAIAKSINVGKAGGEGGRGEGNTARGGLTGPVRIEDIPGRRTPYSLLLEIPIESDDISVREQSFTITQDGPFVCVQRMAVFLSNYEFQTVDPDTGDEAEFTGRSYGRFRPVSSAQDYLDSQHNAYADTTSWYWNMMNNTGVAVDSRMPSATLGMPSSMSSFRTMEFDGRIEVTVSGSEYPRQNRPVPSSFWSKSVSSPWDLAALDFIERGEALTVKVEPMHVNNPPYGNVTGEFVFPQTADAATGWPFLDGQFDAHEGIATPGASTFGQANPELPNLLASDSVVRLPNGILILGWEGYRINQPMGVAP